MRPKLSTFSWLFLGCIVCFCFCSALLAAFCLFSFVVSIFCATLLYSAPGWSSGYRLQSEANPAFKQSRRNSGFICHQRTSKGLTKSKLPRLPEDVRVGTGAVVAHGWTTAKFPHANESPSPCPRVRALACWLPC